MTWYRVKDKATGHEFSTEVVDDEAVILLEKPATNRFGDPKPPKPHVTVATARSETGELLSDMTVPQLHAYADSHEIDLAGASKKDDIVSRISASEQGDPAA